MKIRYIPKIDDQLLVEIQREALFNNSNQTEAAFTDCASIDDSISVALIEGPMRENQKIVIVNREDGRTPYIASSGSNGNIELSTIGSDKLKVVIRAFAPKSADGISRDLEEKLNDAWKGLRAIEKKKGKDIEARMRNLLLGGKFKDLKTEDLLAHACDLVGKAKTKDPEARYRLCLVIIAIHRARDFIAMTGASNHSEVYSTMVDFAGIRSSLQRAIKRG